MKRTTLSLLCLACLTTASAQAADLKIDVAGISDAKGEVFVALYNSADIWLKKPYKVAKATAVKGTTTLSFGDLPEGDYAVSAFQDEDGDRKMGRNAIGIPTEPWGFSKDAMGMFGPPSFDDAKINVPAAGSTIVINLKS
jgi:uncharacterized protein (DUF2141 family)